ncbi:Rossmann-fold NAD(P)-binding domain-containing protein [Sediminibacterium soli]|uniref:hypothetical protein n=1 Tax=Sediminibacterium soli TaxID=2698829 RepID=UPI00137AB817|nr:hypothetical protein [Sediminibacterium soli]NCI46775.1 hypothetical protein [Sediminibacterium soli]
MITHATSCMGQELANLFAQCGRNLILVSNDLIGLEKMAGELRSEYGIKVFPIAESLLSDHWPVTIHKILVHLGFTLPGNANVPVR